MGTLTINTTAGQDARIVSAFGKRLNLGRDATGAEVKREVIATITQMVLEIEQRDAAQAASAAVAPVVPT